MRLRTSSKHLLTALSAAAFINLSASKSYALVKFNDGRDQIFITASLGGGYDSNISASNTSEGDFFTTSSLLLEYSRNAGLIGVNGSIGWNLGSFASNSDQDFSNPTMSLAFTKNTGRTTGSITLSAARQSQADVNVNMRTDSWNYDAALNWKYPVIDRYSLSGSFGYGLVDYTDNSVGLVDLTTYTASTDLSYLYSTERQLLAGYRIRMSDASAQSKTIDHSLTAGVTGKILSKLNGTVRAGYQIRQDTFNDKTYDSWTASASTTWLVNKRMSLTGTLSKDFSTTATDSSVDSSSINVNAQYSFSSHWSLFAGIGAGYNDFLSGIDQGRKDHYLTESIGVNYTLNEHFKASLTYSYFQNWSNRTNSEYDRNTVTLNLTTRW